MRTSILILFSLALTSTICGCDNRQTKLAADLAHIDSLRQVGEYDEAEYLIDSIREVELPDSINAAKLLNLKRSIANELTVKRQEAMIADLQKTQESILVLKDGMLKDPKAEYAGRLKYLRRSSLNPTAHGADLRAKTDTLGNLELLTDYAGNKALLHESFALTTANGETAKTPAIPYDNGLNYRYKSGATFHETISFTGNKFTEEVAKLITKAAESKSALTAKLFDKNGSCLLTFKIPSTKVADLAQTIALARAYEKQLAFRTKLEILKKRIERLRRT